MVFRESVKHAHISLFISKTQCDSDFLKYLNSLPPQFHLMNHCIISFSSLSAKSSTALFHFSLRYIQLNL
jgi:hypothetical protein